MRKWIVPVAALAGGLAVSYGLQGLEVPALWAKLAGLAVVGVVLALHWRRAAGAR